MLWKWNEGVGGIRLEGNGWINGRDVCYFLPLFVSDSLMVHISHYSPFFLFQRLLSILFPPPGFNFILENLFHLYSFLSLFLSFFLSPPPPFFQPSLLNDYSGDGPVKASPIIVFEQHCSLALCSSETRLFSICSLYHTNTGQLCLITSDMKFITFIFTQAVTDHYYWQPEIFL